MKLDLNIEDGAVYFSLVESGARDIIRLMGFEMGSFFKTSKV